MSFQRTANSFNLYDLFSTFLPGALLSLLAVLPVVGGKFAEISIGVGGLIIWIVISFSLGLMLQAVGSVYFNGKKDFVSKLKGVTEGDENTSEVTAVDVEFVEIVTNDFYLESDFDDWGRLYKVILAELEDSTRTRALRLHALYLGMRGLGIATLATAVLYGIYWFCVVEYGYTTGLPANFYPIIITSFILISVLSFKRAKEHNSDVTEYMITEYYLEKEKGQ